MLLLLLLNLIRGGIFFMVIICGVCVVRSAFIKFLNVGFNMCFLVGVLVFKIFLIFVFFFKNFGFVLLSVCMIFCFRNVLRNVTRKYFRNVTCSVWNFLLLFLDNLFFFVNVVVMKSVVVYVKFVLCNVNCVMKLMRLVYWNLLNLFVVVATVSGKCRAASLMICFVFFVIVMSVYKLIEEIGLCILILLFLSVFMCVFME